MRYQPLLIGAFLLAWMAGPGGEAPTAQPEPAAGAAGAIELRPGVLIDLPRKVAYVMQPKGGIEAVALASGGRVWSTTEAAKPLALVGDTLVAQAEPTGATNQLGIVALNVQKGARRAPAGTAGMTVPLPTGTRVTVDDTLEGSFAISARATTEDALLAWEYARSLQQGIRPGAIEDAAGGTPPKPGEPARSEAARKVAGAPAERTVSTGTVRVNASTGRAAAIAPGDPAAAAAAVARRARTPDARGQERLATVPGTQYLSADGRHILTSERVADDRVWDKYEWTIFERAGGRRLGTIRSYRSQAPFVVVDTEIVYETGPFVRRLDEGLVDTPLQVRAVDLRNGRELWTRAVRDTAYRGPFPP